MRRFRICKGGFGEKSQSLPQIVSAVARVRFEGVNHKNACGAGPASPVGAEGAPPRPKLRFARRRPLHATLRVPAPPATPKRRSPTRKEVCAKEVASRHSTAALSQIFGAWSPGKRTFTAFSQRGARCVAEEARSGFFRAGLLSCRRKHPFRGEPQSGGVDPRHLHTAGVTGFPFVFYVLPHIERRSHPRL